MRYEHPFDTVRPMGEIEELAASGHLKAAENVARDRGDQLTLAEALALTAVIARNDRSRGQRVAARWLQRWLTETPNPRISEAVMIAGCLAELGGWQHRQSLRALQGMLDRTVPTPPAPKRTSTEGRRS
jgi:hypothetical protein